MTRTYWLSFTDPDRPTGQKFLGVVVVDVTEDERADAELVRPMLNPDAAWISAALRSAWKAGVNPGGEVASTRIDDAPEAAGYPRLTLLSRADLERLEPLR